MDPFLFQSEGPSSKRRRESGYDSSSTVPWSPRPGPSTSTSISAAQMPKSPYQYVYSPYSPGFPYSVSSSLPPDSVRTTRSGTEEDSDYEYEFSVADTYVSNENMPPPSPATWPRPPSPSFSAYYLTTSDYEKLQQDVDDWTWTELDPIEPPQAFLDFGIGFEVENPNHLLAISPASAFESPASSSPAAAEPEPNLDDAISDLNEMLSREHTLMWDNQFIKYDAIQEAYGYGPQVEEVDDENLTSYVSQKIKNGAKELLRAVFDKEEILTKTISGRKQKDGSTTNKLDQTKVLAIIRILGFLKSCWIKKRSLDFVKRSLMSKNLCEVPLTDPLTESETSDIKGAVFTQYRNQLKQKQKYGEKASSYWRDMDGLLRPEENFPIEVPHTNNLPRIFIPRDPWAEAFWQHDIVKAAKIIFVNMFSQDEIINSTLNGQSGTRVLNPQKQQLLCRIVQWMKDKSRNPYDFTRHFATTIILLSDDEEKRIRKEIFTDYRSQLSRICKKLQTNNNSTS